MYNWIRTNWLTVIRYEEWEKYEGEQSKVKIMFLNPWMPFSQSN